MPVKRWEADTNWYIQEVRVRGGIKTKWTYQTHSLQNDSEMMASIVNKLHFSKCSNCSWRNIINFKLWILHHSTLRTRTRIDLKYTFREMHFLFKTSSFNILFQASQDCFKHKTKIKLFVLNQHHSFKNETTFQMIQLGNQSSLS